MWRSLALLLALTTTARAQSFPTGSVGLLHSLYVDVQGLGPTNTPGSVSCNDSLTRAQNSISSPWCSLPNGAWSRVLPGDIVWIRAGTYSQIATGVQSGFPKYHLGLTRRGSPTHHIWYSAFPNESPVIVPAVPGGGPANCTQQTTTFGGCQWIGMGLMPVGWIGTDDGTCYTEPATWTKAGICGSDADCGGAVGSCHRNSVECTGQTDCNYYTTINGLHFQHWNYWDSTVGIDSTTARLTYYAIALESAFGNPSQLTIQNNEIDDNSNSFYSRGIENVTFQYNHVHDNHLHGWTSAINLYHMRGAKGGQNIIRGNIVHDNYDVPPPWCLARVCSSGSNSCFDQINGYGAGCTCVVNANCQSGVCQANPGHGCDGVWPANDGESEGNGIIVDTPDGLCAAGSPNAGAFCGFDSDPGCGNTTSCQMATGARALIESNIIYNNYGGCINLTRGQNINFRNNTCYHNNLKHRPDQDGEIITFGAMTMTNNLLVPSDLGSCRCSADSDCNGAGASGHEHCLKGTGSLNGICRTGTLSACTDDSQCAITDGTSGFPAGKMCVPSASFHGYTGAANNTASRWPWLFFQGDNQFSGNLAWNTLQGGVHSLWRRDGTAIARIFTTANYKTDTTTKKCTGGTRASMACVTVGDCPGGSACNTEMFGATDGQSVTWGWAGNGTSVNQVFGDPLFTNAAAGDFSLGVGSPAIGAGDATNRATVDQQQRSWVTTDIGALAFGAGTVTTSTTSTSTTTPTTTSSSTSTTSTSSSTTSTLPGVTTTTLPGHFIHLRGGRWRLKVA